MEEMTTSRKEHALRTSVVLSIDQLRAVRGADPAIFSAAIATTNAGIEMIL